MIGTEAKRILKALNKYPNAHIHYHSQYTWSLYKDKKTFERYWRNGKDLKAIEIIEGNDFDSSYASPLVEAILHLTDKTVSSI